MTREAINHVTEAENTVAKIRQNADEKIQAIETKKEEELQRINDELEAEIQSIEKSERQKFEKNLQKKIQANKKDVKNVADEYEVIYSQKKDELSDYIVKEVLRRYGN